MKTLIVAIALMTGFAAFATDYGWANTGTATANWYDVANWTNAEGVAATEAPVTAGSNASFPFIDKTTRRVDLLKSQTDNSVIDSITGGEYWRLALPGGNNNWGRATRSVTVSDVNGFTGEWYSEGAYQTLDLSNATADQKLCVVYPNYHFPIKVPAGITAEMGYVRGSTGSIAKEGAGTLRIGTVMDAETLQVQLNGGTLELAGVIGEEDAILKKAYIHLDANRPETLETYTGDDGRTYVTKWKDVNGSDRYASVWDNTGDQTKSHFKNVHAPFLTENVSSTGLSVMDFGSAKQSEIGTYGPTNCSLRFSERLTKVREIIWVSGWNNGANPAFGDDEDYTFVGGTTKIFTYGHTITNGGGAFWQNANYRAETPLEPDSGGLRRFATVADTYTPTFFDLRLVDIRLAETSKERIHYFSTDRRYADSVGGVKMGEVLVFTNALTDAERQLVGDYLMKRWFSSRPQSLFRNVYAADGTTISVPAGRTAKIDNLVARGTVTKSGAGTLVVGRTVQDNAITVEEGNVQFEERTYSVSTDAPGGTPQFWYDPDQEGCFETDDAGNLTSWHDRRAEYATSRAATRYVFDASTASKYGYPTLSTTLFPGHTVVVCTNQVAIGIPGRINGNYAWQREVFIVFAFADATGAKSFNFLPNGTYTLVRDTTRFLTSGSADDRAAGGVFTIDGVPEYPMESATGDRAFVAGEWHVASAALTGGSTSMNVVSHNGNRNKVGRLLIGEVITYGGALTEDQRRQTTAYLMKKWLGKDHPESKASAVKPALTYADTDNPVVLTTEGGASVESVAGGNGTLVKKGAGAATIVANLDDSFGDLSVQDGSLTIAKPTQPDDDSIYHFDFGDSSTYTESYEDDEGLTRVHKIADVRANGVSAASPGKFSPSTGNFLYVTNPVVRTAEFASGVSRNYLDFLPYTYRNIEPPDDVGAGFEFSPAATATAAESCKEIHVVVAAKALYGNFLNGSKSDFRRGNNGKLLRVQGESSPCPDDVLNGYIAADGVTTNAYYTPDVGAFHLLSFAPLSAKDSKSISLEGMNLYAGGMNYAEIIAFSDYCTAAERHWWQDHLMYKWFAKGVEPLWTNAVDSVSVASGTALSVSGRSVLVTPEVTGGGTIAATMLAEIETVNLAAADRLSVETLTVNGTVSFADAVTVNLTNGANLMPGTYPIVTATALENIDFASWTLTGGPKRYPCVFERNGNTVNLVVQRRGVIFFVR